MKGLITAPMAIPAALIGYSITLILSVLFWIWFFDEPWEWDYFIPIVTSFFSLSMANSIAEEISSRSTAIVVLFIIAAYWVIVAVTNFVGDVQDIYSFILNEKRFEDVFFNYELTDIFLNPKIFAVTSVMAAMGQLDDKKN